MRHLMKHHHSSVCQVLQLMPQLPITFPILVRHLTSILRLIETIFSLLKVLESPYTYKRIYLWHYYKWELNLGHEFGTFIQKKQAEAFYNPINNSSAHLHDLVLALESADVLLVEDRDELRQPPRDLCCAEKSFISLHSYTFSQNLKKATCENFVDTPIFYNYITQLWFQ